MATITMAMLRLGLSPRSRPMAPTTASAHSTPPPIFTGVGRPLRRLGPDIELIYRPPWEPLFESQSAWSRRGLWRYRDTGRHRPRTAPLQARTAPQQSPAASYQAAPLSHGCPPFHTHLRKCDGRPK